MKKALASVVILAFAGLVCTSLLGVFSGAAIGSEDMGILSVHSPDLMVY